MLRGCIVTKLKNTFDSLVCEFTAKVGIVSRCRCNIFTIGNRCTRSVFCFSSLNFSNSFPFFSLKSEHAEYVARSRMMHCLCSLLIASDKGLAI